MDINPYSIAAILAKKFKKESLTILESRILASWLDIPENKRLHDELLNQEISFDLVWLDQLDEEQAWNRIMTKRKRKKNLWLGIAAAAIILLTMSAAAYLFIGRQSFNVQDLSAEVSIEKYGNDVLPANLGARIVLASGKQIDVHDTLNVLTSKQLGIRDKYNLVEDNNEDWNKLVVPLANFFKLILADGTAVWVNSDSELRFPKAFGTTERRVFLKGEAYFEVEKDPSRPFYVETEDLTIRVLGTHFNVSAYNQHSKTTLEEGSVEIIKNSKSVVIEPGQSVEWTRGDLRVQKADMIRDLAWRNNVFYFKEDNLVNITYQLKRWYNLNVKFTDDVSLTETYTGEIRRDVKLTEVLKMLEFVSDLNFKLDKNNLLITKK